MGGNRAYKGKSRFHSPCVLLREPLIKPFGAKIKPITSIYYSWLRGLNQRFLRAL